MRKIEHVVCEKCTLILDHKTAVHVGYKKRGSQLRFNTYLCRPCVTIKMEKKAYYYVVPEHIRFGALDMRDLTVKYNL